MYMRRCTLIAVSLLVATLGLIAPGRAGALSLSPDPLVLAEGVVDFVGMTMGVPVGGVTQLGSVGSADMALVLQVDSVILLGLVVEVSGIPATGGGWIPGPDKDVTADFFFPFGAVRFGGILQAGRTDPFFISVATLTPGDSVVVGTFALGSSGELVIVPYGAFEVVPEPTTALLLVCALLGMGVRRRLH